MSKSAIKTLTIAQEIIAKAGVTVDLVGYIKDEGVRKNWRNADKLAELIINSAANAFQTENSETMADDGRWFDTMQQAIDSYICSNLDEWSQKSWSEVKAFSDMDQLARLAEMVERNMAFEERQLAHAEALEINRTISERWVSPARAATIVDARRQEIEEAHEEALLVNHRRRVAEFFGCLDYLGRIEKVDEAHAEALLEDAQRLQARFYRLPDHLKRVVISIAHQEAIMTAYEEGMIRIFNTFLKLLFRTDGKNVWWYSTNRDAWFVDPHVTIDTLDEMIIAGHARKI